MSSQNISTKLCVYGCGQNLYFNTAVNEYWELFSRKKHVCPNRSTQSKPTTNTAVTSNTNRPYYNKKPWPQKPKMSNSLELLSGPIETLKKQYEILSDLVIVEYNGKVHGSQSHIIADNKLSLIVYYEVPEGQREMVKQKFNNFIKTVITLPRN